MTRSAVKSSALDRNSEERRLKIGDNWSYAPRVKNFWLRHWTEDLTSKHNAKERLLYENEHAMVILHVKLNYILIQTAATLMLFNAFNRSTLKAYRH